MHATSTRSITLQVNAMDLYLHPQPGIIVDVETRFNHGLIVY